MNVYLLQLIGKWLSLIVITFISFFNPRVGTKTEAKVDNEVIEHDTKMIYNPSLPNQTKNVVTPGVDGIVYMDANGNETKIIQKMVTEVIEVGTGGVSDYIGKLSGQ